MPKKKLPKELPSILGASVEASEALVDIFTRHHLSPQDSLMVLSILHDSLTSAIRAKAASEHEQEITE